MEITFFFNIPVTFLGAWCTLRTLTAYSFEEEVPIISVVRTNDSSKEGGAVPSNDKLLLHSLLTQMLVYTSMSLLTLMHYMVESPLSYSAVVNFTIAGEGLAALYLAVLIASQRAKISDSATLMGAAFNVPSPSDNSSCSDHIDGEANYNDQDDQVQLLRMQDKGNIHAPPAQLSPRDDSSSSHHVDGETDNNDDQVQLLRMQDKVDTHAPSAQLNRARRRSPVRT